LGSLSEVLITELWRRNTHEFKSDVIIKQVLTPFKEAGRNPDVSRIGSSLSHSPSSLSRVSATVLNIHFLFPNAQLYSL